MQPERISIEEINHTNRHSLVRCDLCKDRTPATRTYLYERVQDDTVLVLCAHCVGQLKKGGKDT